MSETITHHRNLRTGMAPWCTPEALALPTERLTLPAKTDVVVVGAGITGALVTHAATGMGLSTIVLDRRPPGHGSTAASTALLQFEIDTPLVHLIDSIGPARARAAWQRSQQAIHDLARLIEREEIACDFRPRRALYLAGDVLGAARLAEEGRQRRAIGLPSVTLDHCQLRAIAGIDREAALLSGDSADVDPVRLTSALLRRCIAKGTRVCSPAQLAEVAPGTRAVQMMTSDGVELEAKALVFATGYELADGVPTAGHELTSTWALATRPQPRAIWGEGELIWEASDPYLYIRTTVDGRVMIGGEDEPISDAKARDALLPAKIAALQEKAGRLLPNLDLDADYAWAGTFGASETGLPSIGPIPAMPNCYAVLGFGGNGLTFGVIAADIIAQFLSGRVTDGANQFAFGR